MSQDTFEVVDENGETYTVTRVQHYTDHRQLSGQEQQLPGSEEYTLCTGDHVNPINGDPNVFEVVNMRGPNFMVRRI